MKKTVIVSIITIFVVTWLLCFICIDHANSQDYTRPLTRDYEHDAKTIRQKFDELWNYIRGINYTDVVLFVSDSGQAIDTVYTNIKFDSILYVLATPDTIYYSDSSTFAWIGTLSDSSVIIQKGFTSHASTDTLGVLIIGRIKINW